MRIAIAQSLAHAPYTTRLSSCETDLGAARASYAKRSRDHATGVRRSCSS
jgi:hypothetical protein